MLGLAGARRWTAVIDDSEGRKIANEDQIAYMTTARLLCQAIKSKQMTVQVCAAIADDLLRTEYRLPFSSGEDFLSWAVGEGILNYDDVHPVDYR